MDFAYCRNSVWLVARAIKFTPDDIVKIMYVIIVISGVIKFHFRCIGTIEIHPFSVFSHLRSARKSSILGWFGRNLRHNIILPCSLNCMRMLTLTNFSRSKMAIYWKSLCVTPSHFGPFPKLEIILKSQHESGNCARSYRNCEIWPPSRSNCPF